MSAYVARRLLSGVIVVLVVTAVTFSLLRLVPGGPFTSEKELPPQVLENLNQQYGLNDPFVVQLGRAVAGAALLDFGNSMKFRERSVREVVAQVAPVSLHLGLQAFAIALVLGLGIGFGSAWQRAERGVSGLPDQGLQALVTVGIALPSFVVGGILIYLFAFQWPLLPPARWEGPLHTILPSLTLAAAPAAYIARLSRSSLLDTLGEPFVRTARAKGLREFTVVARHAVPGALYTVITVLGPLLAALVTGSFIVELIFGIPGMGRFFITSVTDRDYTVILGITVLYTAVVVAANLLVDILYALVDPRVRVGDHGTEGQ